MTEKKWVEKQMLAIGWGLINLFRFLRTGEVTEPEKRKVAARPPLTEQDGLIGDLARMWRDGFTMEQRVDFRMETVEVPGFGRDPSWHGSVVMASKAFKASGASNRTILKAWKLYLVEPVSHPSHEGKPISTFAKRLDGYLSRFEFEAEDG